MTYFQNEVWDTGGDGRITITGDIYSTADPLGIFISATPFEVLTLGTAGSEINSDFNVVGAFTVNGAEIGGGSPFTDLVVEQVGVPAVFGQFTVPLVGDFQDALLLDIGTTLGFVVKSGDYNIYIDNGSLDISNTLVANSFLNIGIDALGDSFVNLQNNTETLNIYATLASTLHTIDATGSLYITANNDLALNGDSVTVTGNTVTVNGIQLSPDGFAAIIKATNQDVTNSTTLEVDTDLQFAVVAGKTYSIELRAIYSGSDATGDFKWAIGVDAGTMAGRGWVLYHNSSQTITLGDVNLSSVAESTALVNGTNGSEAYANNMRFEISFLASSSGLFSFRFANNSAGIGRISRCWAGSTLRWKQLD